MEHDENRWRRRGQCDDEEVVYDDTMVSEIALFVEGKRYGCDKKELYFRAILDDLSSKIKEEYFI